MTNGGRAAARDPNPAAEAAATQDTLNYALRNLGGKQKSWMAWPRAPTSYVQNRDPPAQEPNLPVIKRKPGQPARPPSGDLPYKTTVNPTATEAQHDPQLSSNSTSPQLANVLSYPTASHALASPISVLPSPSPSEEATVEHTSMPTPLHVRAIETAGGQDAAPGQNVSVPAKDMSPDIRLLKGAQEFISARKRPAEVDHPDTDRRSRAETAAPQTYPNPLPPRTDDNLRRASFQLRGHGESASPVTTPQFSPSPASVLPRYPSPYLSHSGAPVIQTQNQTGLQANRTPPQGPPPSLPRRASQQQQQQQVRVVPSNNHPSNPVLQPSRQSGDGPSLTWYTKLQCIEELNRFCATVTISNDHARDGKRLEVLRNAVEQQDWAYLTLHQYYCVLDANPASLPPAFRSHPHLPFAVQLLRDVLDKNESLSPAVLHFFANFPMPLLRLSEMFPQRFEQEALMFLNFMQQSANFKELGTICERRHYPLLMRELVHDLGITSAIFQRICFTASLRRLWFTWGMLNPQVQGHYENQALRIFHENQSYFYSVEARRSKNQSLDLESDRDIEKKQWGGQLKQLCDEYIQIVLRSNGSVLPGQPPLVGPQAVVQPRALRPSLQNHHIQQPSVARPSTRVTTAMPPHSAQAAIHRGRGRGRPRLYPTPARPQHLPTNQQVTQHQVDLSPVPLLPARGVHQLQQRQANPARFGLHQANLRSPLLQARSKEPNLYQYVTGFLKAPVHLTDAGHRIEKWNFTLTREEMQQVPKDQPNTAGALPIRVVDENSRILRIRCVKWTSSQIPNEHTFATADTSWIPYSYFTFNGQPLQQRKKIHHGKDLPIDISPFVREGENKLEIAIMRQRNDESYLRYLVAIEILGIKSHETIIKDCRQLNHVSASVTLTRLCEKLSDSNDDDDEIAIVESNLTINLFDPFSASKICELPVRGKECLHYDCFDLDTFLQTRKKQGDATAADQWKCPICNGDARPQHLVIDGFLEHVRAELYRQGLHDTRAIIVSRDGSWKPKVQVRDSNGVQDPDTPDDDYATVRPQPQPFTHAEVIDLID
jgi:hypothetical protein